MKIIEFNMTKILNTWYNDSKKGKYSPLVAFSLGKKELEEFSKGDKIMEKFNKEVNRVNGDPLFQSFMTQEEIDEKTQNTLIKNAKEDGITQGLNEGRVEGHADGERAKALESAKKMLKDKLSLDAIAKYTGLSIEEIKALK